MTAHDGKQKKIYRAYVVSTFLQDRSLKYRPYYELCDGQFYCTLQQPSVPGMLLKQPVFYVYFQFCLIIFSYQT